MERETQVTAADAAQPAPNRAAGPLRLIADLDEPLVKRDACRTLANARVVWADYDLIERDFAHVDFATVLPDGVKLPNNAPASLRSSRPDIDAWLLAYGAIMSEAQLQHADTNEEIPVCGEERTAYRPPRYGRSLVVNMADTWPDHAYSRARRPPEGLLDVKGCGVAAGRVPLPLRRATGLLGLPTALCELITQRIAERIFQHVGADIRGLGVYAILDLGFHAKLDGTSLVPAGAIVRRAHRRPPGNIEQPIYGNDEHRIKLAIEFVLRRFGVTSADPGMRFRIWRENGVLRSSYRGQPDRIPPASLEGFLMKMSLHAPVDFDVINIQLVREATLTPLSATIVDFGQYDFNDRRFAMPLTIFVDNRPLKWGGFVASESRYFVQPNFDLAVDGELGAMVPTPSWIFKWIGDSSPMQTNGLFVFAAELTRDVVGAGLTGSQFEERMSAFVSSATKKLDECRFAADGNGRGGRAARGTSAQRPAAAPADVIDALSRVEGFLAQNKLRWQHRIPRR